MRITLLLTTYNSPLWLQKTLWSVLAQQHADFEVIVADDGSVEQTRYVIEAIRPEFEKLDIVLKYIWQKDDGFRKCRILNKGLLHAESDYIVFTDGDCLLRSDFLAEHVRHAYSGYFLSGTYFKLPMNISQAIERQDIVSQRCFSRKWLVERGLPSNRGQLKLTNSAKMASILNRVTTTACNLKGANASAWLADLKAVGGMDERLQSGGQDRELGVRLLNRGIKARHVRFSAVCLHLDHSRGYRNHETVDHIRNHRKEIEQSGIAYTGHGISLLKDEGYKPELG